MGNTSIRKMFSFHPVKDKDVLEKLLEQTNASAYIKNLIRNDIKGNDIFKKIENLLQNNSIELKSENKLNNNEQQSDLILNILKDMGDSI